jgi:hypothetical protein
VQRAREENFILVVADMALVMALVEGLSQDCKLIDQRRSGDLEVSGAGTRQTCHFPTTRGKSLENPR